MNTGFYVRIRGRVHGPVSRQKLHHLAQRGQLSRIHEISEDGRAWRAASTMPELFAASTAEHRVPEPIGSGVAVRSPSVTDLAASGSTEQQPDAGGSAESSWYYAINGTQHGPVPASEIGQLIRTEHLRREDMVWTHDMEDWSEAGTHPDWSATFDSAGGLVSGNLSLSGSNSHTSGQTGVTPIGDFGGAVRDRLQRSIQPVGVTVVCCFMLGLLAIAGGLICVLACLSSFDPVLPVAAAGGLVTGGLMIRIGLTTVDVKRKLMAVRTNQTDQSIIESLDSANRFWRTLAWALAAILGVGILTFLVIMIVTVVA